MTIAGGFTAWLVIQLFEMQLLTPCSPVWNCIMCYFQIALMAVTGGGTANFMSKMCTQPKNYHPLRNFYFLKIHFPPLYCKSVASVI